MRLHYQDIFFNWKLVWSNNTQLKISTETTMVKANRYLLLEDTLNTYRRKRSRDYNFKLLYFY